MLAAILDFGSTKKNQQKTHTFGNGPFRLRNGLIASEQITFFRDVPTT